MYQEIAVPLRQNITFLESYSISQQEEEINRMKKIELRKEIKLFLNRSEFV